MSLVRDKEALLCLPLKHTTLRARGVPWVAQNGIVITDLFSEDGQALEQATQGSGGITFPPESVQKARGCGSWEYGLVVNTAVTHSMINSWTQ